MVSYFIRECEMVPAHGGCTRCLHCNSATGIGFHFFMRCKLRFNEKGFAKWRNFHNIGESIEHKIVEYKIAKRRKLQTKLIEIKTYCRRFSNETYTRRQMIQQFKQAISIELTRQTINEQPMVGW